MWKYQTEFKLKVVKRFLDGKAERDYWPGSDQCPKRRSALGSQGNEPKRTGVQDLHVDADPILTTGGAAKLLDWFMP